MVDLGPSLGTARVGRFASTVMWLALVMWAVSLAAIVFLVMQRWTMVAVLGATYVVVMAVRLLLFRVRLTLEVHDRGVVIAGRAYVWESLSRKSLAIITSDGSRFSTVTEHGTGGEAVIAILDERWIAHALVRARDLLATGAIAEVGPFRISAAGVELDRGVVPWAELDVLEADGFVLLHHTHKGKSGAALFDTDVPAGPVFRALLREYRRPTHPQQSQPASDPSST